MKIRTGFVSNSSSSSFICDVSGEVYSGYDAGLSDFDLMECTNEHIFHESYLVGDPYEPEILERILIKDVYSNATYDIKDKYKLTWRDELSAVQKKEANEEAEKTILEIKERGEWNNILQECKSKVRNSIPVECCPICSLTYIKDDTISDYLLNKYNESKEEIKKEIREKYNSLQELNNERV